MPDRARLSEGELEAVLRDVAGRVAYPPAPHLSQRVRARLAERTRPRRPWAFSLAPAALTLLVIAAGASAAETIRLRGVEVFRVPQVSAPPVSAPPVSAPPVRALDLGERTTLEQTRTLLRPLTSSDPLLADPDEVYLRRGVSGAQVSFAYRARPSLPAGPSGYGALVGQLSGTLEAPLIGKAAGPNAKVEQVSVGGSPGIWIEGEAHTFFYRDAAGGIREETLRLAGNTLLWQRGELLLRLEAQVSKERALELAGTFR